MKTNILFFRILLAGIGLLIAPSAIAMFPLTEQAMRRLTTSLWKALGSNDASQAQLVKVQQLIKKGADIHAPQGEKCLTPLMAAAYGNNSDIVSTLIQAGARVDAQDHWGRTALWWAVKQKTNPENIDHRITIVKSLLDANASVNKADALGFTIVMCAAAYTEPIILKMLFDAGASALPLTRGEKNALDVVNGKFACSKEEPEKITQIVTMLCTQMDIESKRIHSLVTGTHQIKPVGPHQVKRSPKVWAWVKKHTEAANPLLELEQSETSGIKRKHHEI